MDLKEIKEYVKKEMNLGNYLSYKLLDKRFDIGKNKITLMDVYTSQGVRLLDVRCKRPNGSKEILRKELIDYVKDESIKNHYPSNREIRNMFRVELNKLFRGGIKELYTFANVEYKLAPNQELKYKKAYLLNEVVIKTLLPQLKLKLIKSRAVNENGIDILAEDNNRNLIGIELKAYNKFEMIKSKDINQIMRFIKNERLNRVLFITTTSKILKNIKIQDNIELIDYNNLKVLCKDIESINILEYIRNSSVNKETGYRKKKRELIIEYAKEKVKNGEDINYKCISKDLHLDYLTYFSNIKEIYKESNLEIPLRKIKGKRSSYPDREEMELIINKILHYLVQEVNNGHYPSNQDIRKKFGISHIWNLISMTELYKRIGIKPYLKRKPRWWLC